MSRLDLDSPGFNSLAVEILEGGNALRFRAKGSSMSPIIRDGEYIIAKPVEVHDIRKGDILFCRTEQDKLLVHKVKAIALQEGERKFLLRGENNTKPDGWFSSDCILGRITWVERRGKKILLNSPVYRLKMRLLKQPEEIVVFESKDQALVKRMKLAYSKLPKEKPAENKMYRCSAGISGFHIDAHGMLSMCMVTRFATYDLRAGSFDDAWNHFLPELRNKRKTEYNICADCALQNVCSLCPGHSWLEHGDLEKPVEFLCTLAQLRNEAFDLLA